jgi:hypothetical protein
MQLKDARFWDAHTLALQVRTQLRVVMVVLVRLQLCLKIRYGKVPQPAEIILRINLDVKTAREV